MYICSTTRDERMTISNILCSAFVKLEQVETLLENVQNDYFSRSEQEPINKLQAEDVANSLCIAIDIICDVLTEYELTTGRDTYRTKLHMDSCKRVADAMKCDKLSTELFDVGRRANAEERTEIEMARQNAAELNSEQAIPVLEELLRRVKK